MTKQAECPVCRIFESRVAGLAKRVAASRPDPFGDPLRRKAYQNLLHSISLHTDATGHEVDAVAVVLAFGKRRP